MDSELRKAWGEVAVDALEATIGMITNVTFYEPGIYYVAASRYSGEVPFHGEYYVVDNSCTIISAQAKVYGVPVKEAPELLLFQAEKEQGGYRVIEFEMAKYRIKDGRPLGNLEPPNITAVYGAEDYPEYYGAYPAPRSTPFGYMLRYKVLGNGIFWVETDEDQYTLALCYPIWNDGVEISDTTRELGVLTKCDQEKGIEMTLGYMFFSEVDSCIPLFELLRTHPEWKETEDFSIPALMNAIWTHHAGYAVLKNSLVQQGTGDFLYALLSVLQPEGDLPEPTISIEDVISYHPDAGTKFIDF